MHCFSNDDTGIRSLLFCHGRCYQCCLSAGYLAVLRPVLKFLLWGAGSFGILGVTVQLCIVKDILSMLILHIYCFYVYAAK